MPRQPPRPGPKSAAELQRPSGAANAAPRHDLKQTHPKATIAASSSVPQQGVVAVNPTPAGHIPLEATAAGATVAPVHDGTAIPGGALPSHEERARPHGVWRSTDLPMLRLREFVLRWAPMRIIGLLRPQPARPRHAPPLRELLLENRYTKERQRQLIVVLVIAMLLLYFAGVVGAYVYYDAKEQTPAVPGRRRVPLQMLRSTINGSATMVPQDTRLRSWKRAALGRGLPKSPPLGSRSRKRPSLYATSPTLSCGYYMVLSMIQLLHSL
ncbi:hypothetical protein MTO96_046008 [Rhipicephalus appendiculatus]